VPSCTVSTAAILLVTLLSGCVGLVIETPAEERIENPLPHNATRFLGVTADRWACRSPAAASALATKADYLKAWGEPGRRSATANGEKWSYEEERRWCGVVVLAIVPLPLMLPLCGTHDHVEFERESAVLSSSRRIVTTGGGIFFRPNPLTLILPEPFSIEPGSATHRGTGSFGSAQECAALPGAGA
jgi:hypothetical protein